MILHLTPGAVPVEVHVHGEFGGTERLTVAPRLDAPASAPPAAPASTHGRRWPVVIAPVVAVLAGFVGYQVGAASPRDDARRLASIRDDLRLPQPPHIPASIPAASVLQTVPQTDAPSAGPTELPAEVARLLAQRPTVSSAPSVAAAPAQLRPRQAVPAGGNPFGLE